LAFVFCGAYNDFLNKILKSLIIDICLLEEIEK